MRRMMGRFVLLLLVLVPITAVSFAANAALKTLSQSPAYNGDCPPGSGNPIK